MICNESLFCLSYVEIGGNMINFKNVGLALLTFLFGQVLFAGDKTLLATSGPSRVQLIELYSSESCSSCPPADRWISELKDEAGLWKAFVPVVFHVDYWNHLGWKDGLSSDKMTKRQIDISKTWSSPSVYTPAFIVDGREWSDWRNAVKHRLPALSSNQQITLNIYKDIDGEILVKAEGLKEKKKFIIRAAQMGMDLSSNVTAGENSGAKLKHNFVVLNWDSRSVSGKNIEVQFNFKKPEQKTSRLAIAVWIEAADSPTPLQAVGGYL